MNTEEVHNLLISIKPKNKFDKKEVFTFIDTMKIIVLDMNLYISKNYFIFIQMNSEQYVQCFYIGSRSNIHKGILKDIDFKNQNINFYKNIFFTSILFKCDSLHELNLFIQTYLYTN